jgi:putative ABC transport system permease protein
VVMSEAFWRTRFNADPAIVGRVVRLDGTPYTVVGIVPNDAQLSVAAVSGRWSPSRICRQRRAPRTCSKRSGA